MAKFVSSIDGFMRSFIPEPNSGCWLWEKTLSDRGYGVLQCGGYRGYAHRFSYSHFKGQIPQGLHVCHRCDLPCCVNPDHLWVGTAKDNMSDCKAKGRHASDRPTTNYARGERQAHSKLTPEDVLKIRALEGIRPQRALAKDFGVSKNSIKLVIMRKTWRHV